MMLTPPTITRKQAEDLWLSFMPEPNWSVGKYYMQGLRDAEATLTTKWLEVLAGQEPYAYAVYFPDQPVEMLAHDLDDLCDEITNREHSITKLYTTPVPAQVPMSNSTIRRIALAAGCYPEHDDGALVCRLIRAVEAHHGIGTKGGGGMSRYITIKEAYRGLRNEGCGQFVSGGCRPCLGGLRRTSSRGPPMTTQTTLPPRH